ncbi:MAG TPA: pseudouridine synthase [Gammaproteobacteria bacterium]|nr:pseudouridine synthase [Gammaproteobacteria bacterium]
MSKSDSGSLPGPRHGVARVLSKRGLCSRSQAAAWVRAGRVRINGRVVRDPEYPVHTGRDQVEVDGAEARSGPPLYVMLNKPRGLVTTARDEQGRDTVYRCFEGAGLPWIAPVGRLDRASEGLLLFSNDPVWSARVTGPAGVEKLYHVQINGIPDAAQLARLQNGIEDNGEMLKAKSVRLLRQGARNAWLEIILEQGRNRQIRRMLSALDISVLRLIRIAIGPLALGDLGKGQWRYLDRQEIEALGNDRIA